MKKKFSLVLASLLIILIVFFPVSVNAQNTEKIIEDEKALVRTTAALARGKDANNIVSIENLTEELNKYVGTGVTIVTEKSSDILLVKFVERGRQYEVEKSTGNLYEELYTITYDANGGTGAPEAQQKHHGIDITLSSISPIRTGYKFLGWSINGADVSAQYTAGATFSLNANTTLFAIWEANTYTIKYNANGGSGAPTEQTKTHNVNLILSETEPTRTGYKFLGWNISSTSTTAKYIAGETFTKNEDTTLYAIWEANTYTIKYNANGGSGAPSTQTKTHDIEITLSVTIPIRQYHTFIGWSTESSAETATYSPGQRFTQNEDTTLYAVWTKDSYTVTYNANGGTGANKAVTQACGTSTTIKASDTFTAPTGQHFVEWNTASDGTGDSFSAGTVYTGYENITLYAIWEMNTYTITYNANGGTGEPDSQTKTYGVRLILSTTEPIKTGYAFLGWSTSSSATTATYSAGGAFTDNEDTTLYAVWEANKYTITYNANGGSGAPSNQIKTHDVKLTLPDTIPTKTGYAFLGWSISSTATTAIYFAGGVFTNNADTTLYAVWKANTYSITYNANGGSGAPAAQTKTHDIDLTLSETIPIRQYHTFEGWSTDASAITATYSAGQTFTVNANTTLYAVWTEDSYTVTYNANGGTGANKAVTQVCGTSMTLKETDTFTAPTGKHFLEWNTASDGTGSSYNAGATYIGYENITLYAIWEINTYIIRYDENGGSGAPEAQTKIHDINLTLSDEIPTRQYHTFEGWSTSATATTATYSAGGTFTENADTTLYAVWTINSYTVTYNANGGTGANKAVTQVCGTDMTLNAANTFTAPTGKHFLEWNTASDGSGSSYGAGATYSKYENITLYAIWETNTYTITYDANTGTGAPAAQTKTHDVNLTLSETVPTKTGYTFLGWGTSSITTTVTYSAGGTFTENADTTLYAVWKANTYTITYNANGGVGAPVAQTKTHDINLTLSETIPTQTGYTFLGWNTSSTATTATYSAGAVFTDNADTTLYAIWRLNTYTITYDANTGTGAPVAQTKTHDVNLTLSETVPTKTGYTFLGWSTNSISTTATYSAGAVFTDNADTTLYAVWKAKIEVGAIVTYKDLTWTVTALTEGIVTISATEPYGACTLCAEKNEDLTEFGERINLELDEYCNNIFGNSEKNITAIAASESQGWTGTIYWLRASHWESTAQGCNYDIDTGEFGAYYVLETGTSECYMGDWESNTGGVGAFVEKPSEAQTYAVWPILTLPLELIEQASDGLLIIN